jgi:hypothetical protein
VIQSAAIPWPDQHWPADIANPLETDASPALIAACALRVAEELEKVWRGWYTFGELKERADSYRASARMLTRIHADTNEPAA